MEPIKYFSNRTFDSKEKESCPLRNSMPSQQPGTIKPSMREENIYKRKKKNQD
jgi:hypothetical protein